MSSPPAAAAATAATAAAAAAAGQTPTSMAGKEPAKATTKPPVAASGTNPSTPAAQATPTANNQANFLSPSAGRVAGKTLGKTLAGHHHSSPGVSLGTPNLNNVAAAFDSPSFLGMEPGSSSMGLSMSGIGMGMSMGMGMGLSASALGSSSMGKLDDAERRRRLEAVLHILSSKPGRVSQAGLERLARKLGMDLYSETSGNDRLMTLASGAYAIDITFHPKESANVSNVALQFHGLADSVSEKAPAAAAIFQKDLQSDSTLPTINVMLDRFADNLERISRLDRLSVTGANCFEAIAGVHASLERLYEHEKKTAKALQEGLTETGDEAAAREVMTKKSGRPRMHARRRIGLSLEYWQHERLVPRRRTKVTADSSMMDVDGEASTDPSTDSADKGIHSLTVECEHCPPALYQSIRITNDWLSPQVVKPLDTSADAESLMQDSLDWTEPSQPLISGVEPDPMSSSAAAQSTQPQARFIARLEPAVALPFSVAVQVQASVGVDITQDTAQMQAQQITYDGLSMGRDRPSRVTRRVTTFNGEGDPEEQSWEIRNYVARPEFGREVVSIPFGHPRQLMPILPVLRQYVLFAKLLRSASQDEEAKAVQNQQRTSNGAPPEPSGDVRTDLEELLDMDEDMEDARTSRVLDVTLTQASPVPRLLVTLSLPGGPAAFNVEVQSNAELSVVQNRDYHDDAAAAEDKTLHKNEGAWTRALATCEDLALWAEWMQRQHASKAP